MAKGRMLNKSISLSMKFHQLPDDTCRLLATWIIPHLDKCGVFYGDAAIVKSLIFPMRPDVTVEQVREYLKAMQSIGLIALFESDGRVWQHWTGFTHNQIGLRDDRETTDYATPPASCTGDNPKGDAGLMDESRQTSGKHPADCRQSSAEKTAEKNRKEIEKKGNAEGAASAAPIVQPATPVVYEAQDMGNTTISTPQDPADMAFRWMEQNDKSVRLLKTSAKSPTALDACMEFYRVSGIKVLNAKGRLAGGQALYEACGGQLSLIEKAYRQLHDSGAFVADEWSLLKTVNVLASQKPAPPTEPTRRIIEWQELPDGSMLPIYEAVQS